MRVFCYWLSLHLSGGCNAYQKLSLKFLLWVSTSSWGVRSGLRSCKFLCSLASIFCSCSSLTWCSLSFSWMNSLPHSLHFTIGWWWMCLAWLIKSSYFANFSPHWSQTFFSLWWRMSKQLLCNWNLTAINRLYFCAYGIKGIQAFHRKTIKERTSSYEES